MRRLPTIKLGLALLCGGAAIGGLAAANPALDVRYGNPAMTMSPEADAMAGTGVAVYRGGFSNVLNPACLAQAGPGMRADAALTLGQEHEDRFAPVFDSFTSYLTDTAIASNRHHFFGAAGAVAMRLPVGELPLVGEVPVAAALSLTDRYGFAYEFAEDLLSPDPYAPAGGGRDALIQQRAVEIDGALRAFSAGVGVAPLEAVSLGAALHYQFGTREEIFRLRDYQTPANGYRRARSSDLEGLSATYGALLRVNSRLDLGLAYETALIATGTAAFDSVSAVDPGTLFQSSSHLGIDYPKNLRAGLVYRPRTDPRTVFAVDAIFTTWSDLDDSRLPDGDNPQDLQDTWDVRVGLEHLFRNGTAARFGFRRLDSYADREVGASFFTAGVGIAAAGGAVTAAAELSKVASVQGNWFPYPVGYEAPELTRVENTLFRLGVGFTRSF